MVVEDSSSLNHPSSEIRVSRRVIHALVACCSMLVVAYAIVAVLASMLITVEQQRNNRHSAFCQYLSNEIAVYITHPTLNPLLSGAQKAFTNEMC